MAVSGDAAAALVTRLKDSGWTPGIRDLPGLLDLVAGDDDDLARAAERAVLRIEVRQTERVASETAARARAAVRPARGRLTRLAGRLAMESPEKTGDARSWILEALTDADPKTRHAAARGAGKLAGRGASDDLDKAVLAAWDASAADEDRRALADALGRSGSPDARRRITEAASLGPRATRAAVMIDRSAARTDPGAIDVTRSPASPLVVRLHARAGLEAIVEEEVGETHRPRVAGPGLVEARLTGPLSSVTSVRTATHVGFPVDPVQVRKGDSDAETVLAETIVRALLAPKTLEILRTFTVTTGPIRFRLAFSRGGHRRALAWRCAELVAASTKELVNDPTESTWEVVVEEERDHVALELVPRAFEDDRFAYRTRVVPASSHPTIAAALARVTPQRPDDVVWDPFTGAGAELVERAKLGPYARLIGTDVDAGAIAAARANLGAAKVQRFELLVADALRHTPKGVTVIVTNPPMGRRVERGSHADLLARFAEHAARVLVPGGALVWTVPEPRAIHPRAARAGLVLEREWTVDMGGFPASLSVHRCKV